MPVSDSVPVLDARLLDAGPHARARFIEALLSASRDTGAFQLEHCAPHGLLADALDTARALFALPPEEKDALDIARSPHFRGFSRMRNGRDWREQLHLGREEPPTPGGDPLRLQGPNLWPEDPRFRRVLLGYQHAVEAVGLRLLAAMAEGMGLPADVFPSAPYLITKLIHYLPQPGRDAAPRPGIAAHCDFCWLTLLLQDSRGGLQVLCADGTWVDVEPRPDTLVVNLGELLQVATGGALVATPHRVTNRSFEAARTSLPVFVCPGLHDTVRALPVPPEWRAPRSAPMTQEHVHRVVPPSQAGVPLVPFVFGDAEWRRKGLGMWCAECCSAPP